MMIKLYTYFVSIVMLVLVFFVFASARAYIFQHCYKTKECIIIVLVFQILDLRAKCWEFEIADARVNEREKCFVERMSLAFCWLYLCLKPNHSTDLHFYIFVAFGETWNWVLEQLRFYENLCISWSLRVELSSLFFYHHH